jgi:MFS family permease
VRAVISLFRNRWWVVFATICGLLVGAGPINVFTFGVFLKPITEDLGLSRGAFSMALTVHAAIAAIVLPIIGWLVDRWGARRIMLPGLFVYALATASYALIQASPLLFIFLIFALTGLVGGVQSPIPYAAVIAKWFDQHRGLALGIGTAGVGLGVVVMPQVAALLIDAFGWRLAYVGLAVAVLLVAFPPVAVFLREPPSFATCARRSQQPTVTAAAVPGVAAGEALRSWLFWGLAIAFFLDVIAINGTLTHIVPLLTDRGVPRQVATAALSGTGFALIFGRILSGWCLDRLWGPYVAIAFFVLPMIGIAILISGAGGIAPFLGAIACGLGIGAEIDLMAFFTSRYFGLRDYAKLYGTMFGIFALGVGIGPAVSGASFDRFHSYTPALMIFVIMLAAGCIIFLRLGPYPFPALGQALSGGAEKMPA